MQGQETRRLKRKDEALVVDVVEAPSTSGPCVALADLDDLFKIAHRYESVVLRLSTPHEQTFWLWDQGMLFTHSSTAHKTRTAQDAADPGPGAPQAHLDTQRGDALVGPAVAGGDVGPEAVAPGTVAEAEGPARGLVPDETAAAAPLPDHAADDRAVPGPTGQIAIEGPGEEQSLSTDSSRWLASSDDPEGPPRERDDTA